MKAIYLAPSGDYHLVLSKEDLLHLLGSGKVSAFKSIPTMAGEWTPDGEKYHECDSAALTFCEYIIKNESSASWKRHPIQFVHIEIEDWEGNV